MIRLIISQNEEEQDKEQSTQDISESTKDEISTPTKQDLPENLTTYYPTGPENIKQMVTEIFGPYDSQKYYITEIFLPLLGYYNEEAIYKILTQLYNLSKTKSLSVASNLFADFIDDLEYGSVDANKWLSFILNTNAINLNKKNFFYTLIDDQQKLKLFEQNIIDNNYKGELQTIYNSEFLSFFNQYISYYKKHFTNEEIDKIYYLYQYCFVRGTFLSVPEPINIHDLVKFLINSPEVAKDTIIYLFTVGQSTLKLLALLLNNGFDFKYAMNIIIFSSKVGLCNPNTFNLITNILSLNLSQQEKIKHIKNVLLLNIQSTTQSISVDQTKRIIFYIDKQGKIDQNNIFQSQTNLRPISLVDDNLMVDPAEAVIDQENLEKINPYFLSDVNIKKLDPNDKRKELIEQITRQINPNEEHIETALYLALKSNSYDIDLKQILKYSKKIHELYKSFGFGTLTSTNVFDWGGVKFGKFSGRKNALSVLSDYIIYLLDLSHKHNDVQKQLDSLFNNSVIIKEVQTLLELKQHAEIATILEFLINRTQLYDITQKIKTQLSLAFDNVLKNKVDEQQKEKTLTLEMYKMIFGTLNTTTYLSIKEANLKTILSNNNTKFSPEKIDYLKNFCKDMPNSLCLTMFEYYCRTDELKINNSLFVVPPEMFIKIHNYNKQLNVSDINHIIDIYKILGDDTDNWIKIFNNNIYQSTQFIKRYSNKIITNQTLRRFILQKTTQQNADTIQSILANYSIDDDLEINKIINTIYNNIESYIYGENVSQRYQDSTNYKNNQNVISNIINSLNALNINNDFIDSLTLFLKTNLKNSVSIKKFIYQLELIKNYNQKEKNFEKNNIKQRLLLSLNLKEIQENLIQVKLKKMLFTDEEILLEQYSNFEEKQNVKKEFNKFATEYLKWTNIKDELDRNLLLQTWIRYLNSLETPLPDWTLNNEKFNYGKYVAYFLTRNDPRGLFLGNITNCCQHPSGAGSFCAFHGQTSPYGAFFVVEDKEGEILAQSWVWQDINENIIFDNIESKGLTPERQSDIRYIYKDVAKKIKLFNHLQIKNVFVGLSFDKAGLKKENLNPFHMNSEQLDANYKPILYSDAKEQVVQLAKNIQKLIRTANQLDQQKQYKLSDMILDKCKNYLF